MLYTTFGSTEFFVSPDFLCSLTFLEDPETEVEGGKEEGGGEQELLLPGRTRQTVSPALHGCSLEIKKGELVAVVGTVGSGKSRSKQHYITTKNDYVQRERAVLTVELTCSLRRVFISF